MLNEPTNIDLRLPEPGRGRISIDWNSWLFKRYSNQTAFKASNYVHSDYRINETQVHVVKQAINIYTSHEQTYAGLSVVEFLILTFPDWNVTWR